MSFQVVKELNNGGKFNCSVGTRVSIVHHSLISCCRAGRMSQGGSILSLLTTFATEIKSIDSAIGRAIAWQAGSRRFKSHSILSLEVNVDVYLNLL